MRQVRTVLLVNPPYSIKGAYYLAPQIGLAIAARHLTSAQIPFAIVDQALELAEGKLPAGPDLPREAALALASAKPARIAFSVQCFNAPIVIAIADWLRKIAPEIEIFAGGHHAPHLRVGREPGCVDAIAEDAAFLGAAPLTDDWSIAPDYSGFPPSRRYIAASRQFSALVEVARGCPYACSFCSIPQRTGSRRRYKPIAAFAAEVDFWLGEGVDDFHLVDDVLTVGRRSLEPFLDWMEGRALTWTGMTRADLVDPSLLARLARAGCRGLLYGIESADTATRAALNKRAGRYPLLSELARWNAHAGLRSTFYFLFNLPGETIESVKRTIAEACRMSAIDPGCVRLNLPRLVPRTPLWDQALDAAVPDLRTPYADTLRDTVGEDCTDILQLLASQPEVFSTYYSAAGPLDAALACSVARGAAALLENYPITASLLSEEGLFLAFFEQIAGDGALDDPAAALCSFLAERVPSCGDLPAAEAASRGRELHAESIDLRTARRAAIGSYEKVRSAVERDLRQHRTAALSSVRQVEEACYGYGGIR